MSVNPVIALACLIYLLYAVYQIAQAAMRVIRDSATPAWCSGCDMLQPTASMDFTEVGLYWCDICRHPEKVLRPSHDIADNITFSVDPNNFEHDTKRCTCRGCRDRAKMRALRTCVQCGRELVAAMEDAKGQLWCTTCHSKKLMRASRGGAGCHMVRTKHGSPGMLITGNCILHGPHDQHVYDFSNAVESPNGVRGVLANSVIANVEYGFRPGAQF